MLNTPLQMLLVMLAGWVNEQHRVVNLYLREENRVLRELHGNKRLRFSDGQRTDLLRYRRSSRASRCASVVLPRDQLPMPPQNRVWCHDRLEFSQHPPPEAACPSRRVSAADHH